MPSVLSCPRRTRKAAATVSGCALLMGGPSAVRAQEGFPVGFPGSGDDPFGNLGGFPLMGAQVPQGFVRLRVRLGDGSNRFRGSQGHDRQLQSLFPDDPFMRALLSSAFGDMENQAVNQGLFGDHENDGYNGEHDGDHVPDMMKQIMPALAPPARADPQHVLDNLMRETDGDPTAEQIVETLKKEAPELLPSPGGTTTIRMMSKNGESMRIIRIRNPQQALHSVFPLMHGGDLASALDHALREIAKEREQEDNSDGSTRAPSDPLSLPGTERSASDDAGLPSESEQRVDSSGSLVRDASAEPSQRQAGLLGKGRAVSTDNKEETEDADNKETTNKKRMATEYERNDNGDIKYVQDAHGHDILGQDGKRIPIKLRKRILVMSAATDPMELKAIREKFQADGFDQVDIKNFEDAKQFIDADDLHAEGYHAIHDLGVLPRVWHHEHDADGDGVKDEHHEGQESASAGLFSLFMDKVHQIFADDDSAFHSHSRINHKVLEQANDRVGGRMQLDNVSNLGEEGLRTAKWVRRSDKKEL